MKKITSVLVLSLFLSLGAKAQINMGINIQENPDGSVNMDMQMDTPEGSIRSSQSAGMNGVQQNVNIQESGSSSTQIQQEVWNPAPQPRTSQPAPQPGFQQQQPVPQRCMYAMSPYDFQQAKQSIGKQTFEDTKIQVVKQVAGANCLSTAQVKDLLQLFTFEENKLDLAKALYGVVVDKNNYYLVNDVFTYSSSVDELNDFLMGK